MQKFAHGGHTDRRLCFLSVCGTFIEHKWRSLKAVCGPHLALFAKTQLFPLHFPFHYIFNMAFPVLCSGYDSRNAKKKKKKLRPAQFLLESCWKSRFQTIWHEFKQSKRHNELFSNTFIKSRSCFAAIFWFGLLLHHVHRIPSFSLLSFKNENKESINVRSVAWGWFILLECLRSAL